MSRDLTHSISTPTARERPILFSGPLIRRILAGEKSQTRRLFFSTPGPCGGGPTVYGRGYPRSLHPYEGDISVTGLPCAPSKVSGCLVDIACPFGVAGGRLAVLEAHALTLGGTDPRHSTVTVRYLADDHVRELGVSHAVIDGLATQITVQKGRGRPGRFLPRWASRIALDLTGVRVERLRDITDDDIRAEGVDHTSVEALLGNAVSPSTSLRDLWRLGWDHINGAKAPWSAEVFVWRLEFVRRST